MKIKAYQSRFEDGYYILRDCVGDEAGARVSGTNAGEITMQLKKAARRFWLFPEIQLMSEKV